MMETCYGIKLHTSAKVDGRQVPWSLYYVGRGKDGPQTSTKPHNAALMTKALANLVVTKLNNTGHHSELCELLCDENSTIHTSPIDLGEEVQPPTPPPASLAELSKAIENCFHRDHLSPLEVLNHCNRVVLLG
jgi:hypothetical protein